MRWPTIVSTALMMVAASTASAATFTFNSDPFAGSTALTTPGRQIVGGEPIISFDPAADKFVFHPSFFAIGNTVSFANDLVGNLPASGLNVIVLRTLDNDANAGTPFGAGAAANLLADRIVADGAGLFIYFNSGLGLPRLVYSTNLNDPVADLKVLARMSNLAGDPALLSSFTAENFAISVPEPATWATMIAGFALIGAAVRRSKASAVNAALPARA